MCIETVSVVLDLTVGGLIEKTLFYGGGKEKLPLKHTNNYKYLRLFLRYPKMLKNHIAWIQSNVMTKQARGKIVYTTSNLFCNINK